MGAEPPLGSLYGVPVWLDASFEDRSTIAFNAEDTFLANGDVACGKVYPLLGGEGRRSVGE